MDAISFGALTRNRRDALRVSLYYKGMIPEDTKVYRFRIILECSKFLRAPGLGPSFFDCLTFIVTFYFNEDQDLAS